LLLSPAELFLNSAFVGEYRDPTFTGGKTSLAVSMNSPGSVAADFDNFDQKPNEN